MTVTREQIEEWRKWADDYEGGFYGQLLGEATTACEALLAENETLRGSCKLASFEALSKCFKAENERLQKAEQHWINEFQIAENYRRKEKAENEELKRQLDIEAMGNRMYRAENERLKEASRIAVDFLHELIRDRALSDWVEAREALAKIEALAKGGEKAAPGFAAAVEREIRGIQCNTLVGILTEQERKDQMQAEHDRRRDEP